MTRARAYGASAVRIPGAHGMMLDGYWEIAASAVERAIAEHVSSTVRGSRVDLA